jgi:hypothetical protein
MNTPSPELRLRRLISRWCDDLLSPEEMSELDARLANEPGAAQLFAEMTHLNAALENLGPAIPEAIPQVERRAKLNWMATIMAIAAVLIAVGIPLRFAFHQEPERTATGSAAPAVRSVAVVNNILDATWYRDTPILRPGDLLAPSRIRFESGLIQIQFFNGVQAVLEGPADFEILSAEESFCHRGRFHAIVPPQANCFRVRTAQGELIDFGTEFGVDVSPDSAAVHVFDGEVAFQPADDRIPTRVGMGHAALIGADGSAKAVTADPNLFASYREVNRMKAMSTEKRLADWYRYSLFWRSHPAGVAYFDFEDNDYLTGTIRGESANPYREPVNGLLVGTTLGEGRWPGKAALVFARTSDRVRVSLPGTSRAFTLSAWVRLNRLESRQHGLIMTDSTREGSVHWSIDGAAHALRLDTGTSDNAESEHTYVSRPVITRDLLNQWVFLATTYDTDLGVVEHFLNGRSIGRQSIENSGSLRIGVADIGNWTTPSPGDHHLEGAMDEVMVLSVALAPDQLTGIAIAGKPY